jgi:hypothetical protein
MQGHMRLGQHEPDIFEIEMKFLRICNPSYLMKQNTAEGYHRKLANAWFLAFCTLSDTD